MLFEDQEHLQGGGVGDEHGDLVNHGSLRSGHVRKQVLQKSEGVTGEGFMDEESREESFRTAGAMLENLDTNGFEVERSSGCWDETIDDQDISAEEKVFFLLANPIRGFKC